jgi:peptidoglycan/xylan/chitin deacetylase (PgdA/CDA1 family)
LLAGVVGVIAAAGTALTVRSPRPARRAPAIAFGTALTVVTFGLTAYFGASTVSAQWFGGGVTHGPRNSGEVALTIDDAPNSTATAQIMDILDNAHVHATFFVVGQDLVRRPDVVRSLYEHGHLVANHSFHYDQWRWLDPRYPELERAQLAFQKEIGTCPAWFRPPNGDRTPFMARVVRRHNMRMAMWDVSANNKHHQTANDIVNRVVDNARSGSIIDLRDGVDGASPNERAALVQALPRILDWLRSKHLKPVRLDELVGGPAYTSCGGNSS